MDEVFAHGVQPAVPPPLGKKVILPVEVDRAIHIIDPSFLTAETGHGGIGPWLDGVAVPIPGGEMKLRPERLMIKRFGRNGLGCLGQSLGSPLAAGGGGQPLRRSAGADEQGQQY
ncbi:MAG: hypothetical protein ABSG59_12755 [Verrucomicrobiota bacterium]